MASPRREMFRRRSAGAVDRCPLLMILIANLGENLVTAWSVIEIREE